MGDHRISDESISQQLENRSDTQEKAPGPNVFYWHHADHKEYIPKTEKDDDESVHQGIRSASIPVRGEWESQVCFVL